MARSLSEIYSEAKSRRNQYLELEDVKNTSKMSIIEALTWVVCSCIWTLETLMDVFMIDISRDLRNRVNGTPAYYAQALKRFQYGDSLMILDEGTRFGYAAVDESKRIISRVAYNEAAEAGFHDKTLMLKVAKGTPESGFERLTHVELTAAQAYMSQIVFAGTHYDLVSRKGDVLIPRVTVYHDGQLTSDQIHSNIETSLNRYISSLDFNSCVYVQQVLDAILHTDHITDVNIDEATGQGVYIARYDDDDTLVTDNGVIEVRINRKYIPSSGYLRQSSAASVEKDLPTWKSSIRLVAETTETA